MYTDVFSPGRGRLPWPTQFRPPTNNSGKSITGAIALSVRQCETGESGNDIDHRVVNAGQETEHPARVHQFHWRNEHTLIIGRNRTRFVHRFFATTF